MFFLLEHKASSNAGMIFWLRRVHQMLGGQFLWGQDIFLLGEALKFGLIFQKFSLKLLKY